MARLDAKGTVYFLRAGDGPIKIGYTSRLVWERLAEVGLYYPYELRTVLALPGSPRDEREHHEAFAHLRLRGEWFRPEADLLAYIRYAERLPDSAFLALFFMLEARRPDGARPRHMPEPWCCCRTCFGTARDERAAPEVA